ncbi:MAG: hypothetical protein CMP63_02065 [Flavobacteriales bacterium]|nr:hypothetical protein [Flavobacteriales bacterium]
MKQKLIITFCLISFSLFAGDNGYFVIFNSKSSIYHFDPYSYFDQKAIENKIRMGLPIYDWYDLPVNPDYVSEVASFSDSLGYRLRWFNGVTVYCSEKSILKIKQLSFVKKVIKWKGNMEILPQAKEIKQDVVKKSPIFQWQLNTMGGELFQKRNIFGEGVRISIVDVGFRGADDNNQLNHVFTNNKFIDSWDFSRNKPLDFTKGPMHGTMVASFVVGKLDSIQIGHAPKAEVLFAKMKSITNSNKSIEEAWLKAVEWSHRKGARLVNSSVGYTEGNHTIDMLTGDICLMSLAGNLASRKGMLIINSAGNEGANDWKMIGFPSDADSVLTVGAIDPKSGVRTDYSSYGPSKDLNLKPNVTAVGDVFWHTGSGIKKLEGTSFSTPLVTGYAACVLQNQPDLIPMSLIDTIQKTASLYPYYDYSHGYGVPRATLYFDEDTIKNGNPSIALLKSPNYLVDGYYYFKYLSNKGSHVFYQIIHKDGYIRDYKVVTFEKNNQSPKIYFKDLSKGEVIRVFHRGTYIEKKIE